MSRALRWVALCASLSGCAFFGKSEPLSPSYYTAEVPEREPQPASTTARPELRLGGVLGGSHLRDRIAFRKSEHELGFYEERRWTERPEAYVRRALLQELFQERGLVHVVSGLAPSLEVELVSFDELQKPEHAVRVSARVTLLEGRSVRLERTFREEQRVEGEGFGEVARAMSQALERCVDAIADQVVGVLGAKAATPVPAEK